MMAGMGTTTSTRRSKVEGFDVTKPTILVYLKNASAWQLGYGPAAHRVQHPPVRRVVSPVSCVR